MVLQHCSVLYGVVLPEFLESMLSRNDVGGLDSRPTRAHYPALGRFKHKQISGSVPVRSKMEIHLPH